MQMIIANRLSDGLVVFMTEAGSWSQDIAEGIVINDDGGDEKLLSAAKADEAACKVIDPTLIEVSLEEGSPRPVAMREVIRAFGPTV